MKFNLLKWEQCFPKKEKNHHIGPAYYFCRTITYLFTKYFQEKTEFAQKSVIFHSNSQQSVTVHHGFKNKPVLHCRCKRLAACKPALHDTFLSVECVCS